jgi:hypothetical protein
VTGASPTSRFGTALVALLFALGWGVPTAHAACGASHGMGAEHCGGTETATHCDGEMSGPSPVCVTHHASQEARTEAGPSVDPVPTTGAERSVSSVDPAPGRSVSRQSSGRAVPRVCRFHARVGVWLE